MKKQDQTYYPVLIVRNPTKDQLELFESTIRLVQANTLKHHCENRNFEDWGKLNIYKQKNERFAIYSVNDMDLYRKLCINAPLFATAISFIIKNKVSKKFEDLKEACSNMEMAWINANGDTLPLDFVPFCIINKPTSKILSVFNKAVNNYLENNDIFSLIANENNADNNVIYYLKFNNIFNTNGMLQGHNVTSEKQLAFMAGLSALERIYQDERVTILDETGMPTTKCVIDNCNFKFMENSKKLDKLFNEETPEILPHALDTILKQVVVPQDFYPVFIKRIRKQSETTNLIKIAKSMNRNIFKTDDNFEAKSQNLTIDDIDYTIIMFKGETLKNLFVYRSSIFEGKMRKENTILNRSYPLFVIEAKGKLRRADSVPVCVFNSKELSKEEIKEAVNGVSKIISQNYIIVTKKDGNKTICYMRNHVTPKANRHTNYDVMHKDKNNILKYLKQNNYPHKILDDDGSYIEKYKRIRICQSSDKLSLNNDSCDVCADIVQENDLETQM